MVKSKATAEKAQWLAEGRAAKQQLASAAPESTKNTDGSTTGRS